MPFPRQSATSASAYCCLLYTSIIAVPAEAAQSTADLLVKSGVRAIMTFANVRLKVPDGVIVQYENMALSLAHLDVYKRQEFTERSIFGAGGGLR